MIILRHTHIIKKGEIYQKPKSSVVWEVRSPLPTQPNFLAFGKYICIHMEFLQVSYVKCSTGKGSCYRRVKLFCCGFSRFGT